MTPHWRSRHVHHLPNLPIRSGSNRLAALITGDTFTWFSSVVAFDSHAAADHAALPCLLKTGPLPTLLLLLAFMKPARVQNPESLRDQTPDGCGTHERCPEVKAPPSQPIATETLISGTGLRTARGIEGTPGPARSVSLQVSPDKEV